MSNKKGRALRVNRLFARLRRCALLCMTAAAAGCNSNDDNQDSTPTTIEQEAKAKDLLVFPDDLHTTDDSINQFVKRAMRTCAAGEYPPFRLLWSVREEPLPRDEYDTGWQAVQEVRIRLLEQVRLAGKKALPPTADRTSHDSQQVKTGLDNTGQVNTCKQNTTLDKTTEGSTAEGSTAEANQPTSSVRR